MFYEVKPSNLIYWSTYFQSIETGIDHLNNKLWSFDGALCRCTNDIQDKKFLWLSELVIKVSLQKNQYRPTYVFRYKIGKNC